MGEVGQHNQEARGFTESIDNALSSHIHLIDGDDEWERQPDAQFEHGEASCPGLVVEVALNQDARRLRKIAHQYIPASVTPCLNIDTFSIHWLIMNIRLDDNSNNN